MSRAARLGIALALALFAAPGAARAQAPADTTLGRYLDTLRDSTDRYFGRSVAPVDTAGLDSSQAYALAHPARRRPGNPWRLAHGPWNQFNRVDGFLYGSAASLGRPRTFGEIGGRLGYAAGSRRWLGAGYYEKSLREGLRFWRFEAAAGRLTASMDRERPELYFPSVQALVSGTDTRRYLRRDGLAATLSVEHPAWRGALAFRDQLEAALPVTARWDLARKPLLVSDNLDATRGRVHELGYRLAARTPWVPFTAEAEYLTSSRKIGSGFEYRRTRLALGGDVGVGGALALVPQVMWGHLSGEPVPQAAFYLGGAQSLRSVEGGGEGGTAAALGRLDVFELPDMLEVLRIPHPAVLPLQVGAFLGSGAVSGSDPFGGPPGPGADWPARRLFRSEAGVSVLYRPGVPDPAASLQFSWGWPIGAHRGPPRLAVAYTRGLDLVRPFGREGEEP